MANSSRSDRQHNPATQEKSQGRPFFSKRGGVSEQVALPFFQTGKAGGGSNGFTQPGPQIQRTIGDTRDLSSPRFKGDSTLEACYDGELVIDKNRNSRGDFISALQQALIDAGFSLPQFGADGVFGSETESAVKEFQRKAGLAATDVDGQIGQNTMSRIDSRFTGASATKVEKSCDAGIKTVTIDVVKMRGATGDPAADIAFANEVYKDCCIQFALGTEVTLPDSLSDTLLGGDTDLNMADCNAVTPEELNTFITATSLFSLTSPIIAFYVELLHTGGNRDRGVAVTPLCATGPKSPLVGMIGVANGAGQRTLPHELAHMLMNTFADHNVTQDNVQQISNTATGEKIAPVQCDIMYAHAGA